MPRRVVSRRLDTCAAPLSTSTYMIHRPHRRRALLSLLAAFGALAFAPFLFDRSSLPTPLVWGSLALVGLAAASSTAIWSVISSDPLCNGSEAAGLVGGAVNTLCIAGDSAMLTLFGLVLDTGPSHKAAGGETVFSPAAFSRAFLLLFGAYLVALLGALVSWARVPRHTVETLHTESLLGPPSTVG